MFEKASRLKLRFYTFIGNVTAEDLWDLPLTNSNGPNLDDAAKSISRYIKEDAEESFVEVKTVSNEVLELKLSIVKHVIAVKLEESARASNALINKERKEKLLVLIADKDNEALKSLSREDLKAMVDEL